MVQVVQGVQVGAPFGGEDPVDFGWLEGRGAHFDEGLLLPKPVPQLFVFPPHFRKAAILFLESLVQEVGLAFELPLEGGELLGEEGQDLVFDDFGDLLTDVVFGGVAVVLEEGLLDVYLRTLEVVAVVAFVGGGLGLEGGGGQLIMFLEGEGEGVFVGFGVVPGEAAGIPGVLGGGGPEAGDG